ncbi:MAG: DUF1922 domain-containing protein [Methanomassiliicoccales archaeon]|nr:DUF1922 domain-containing protein [Methanomassiliicoccales archaeon]
MFGVVVCPKCKKARGVVLGSARARCPRCGHSIDLSRARVFYKTDSQTELAEAVKKMMDRLSEGIEEIDVERKRRRPVPAKETRKRRTEESLVAVAKELTLSLGSFEVMDFASSLEIKNAEEASKLIDAMLAQGLLLEPRPGRYRAA